MILYLPVSPLLKLRTYTYARMYTCSHPVDQFLSFTKLTRVTAWMKQFLHNCQTSKKGLSQKLILWLWTRWITSNLTIIITCTCEYLQNTWARSMHMQALNIACRQKSSASAQIWVRKHMHEPWTIAAIPIKAWHYQTRSATGCAFWAESWNYFI